MTYPHDHTDAEHERALGKLMADVERGAMDRIASDRRRLDIPDCDITADEGDPLPTTAEDIDDERYHAGVDAEMSDNGKEIDHD
tara:strand:+ start:628 stop:879 length:252 start_codon:yes stop_codon:yes gene_type:complete